MLNIVHDNLPRSNVWFAPKLFELAFSLTHQKPLPKFLHLADNIVFHTSADNLESFIYPIVMAEPFIQARSLIANQNPYGFWSYVSDSVIQGLREKRGWIVIDMYSEPITNNEFDDILKALSDSSKFPNDRILLNTTSPHFTKNERVFNHPSFLEMGCYVAGHCKSYSPCPCHPWRKTDLSYPHKRFLLLNNHMDYPTAKIFAKYASENTDSFIDSSSDVLGVLNKKAEVRLPQALYSTDVNVVMEAYVDYNVVNYTFITEKTYRNINYKKPFIIMGNRYSLAVIRSLGYKSFHPIIDESYDSIKHTKDRCKKIIKELERLKAMSDDEWDTLLHRCKPTLEHNYNNLLRRIKQTNDWLEGLKDL